MVPRTGMVTSVRRVARDVNLRRVRKHTTGRSIEDRCRPAVGFPSWPSRVSVRSGDRSSRWAPPYCPRTRSTPSDGLILRWGRPIAACEPDNTKALQIPPDELRRRVEVIQGDPDFRLRVGQAQALRFMDKEPSAHVEQRLYDGFPSAADEAIMKQFHQVDWDSRSALAAQIEDPRISQFARRLIYFERPEMLPDEQSAELRAWMANRLLTEDDSVPWMTVRKALRETEAMLQNAHGQEACLLREVRDFLYNRADTVAAGG